MHDKRQRKERGLNWEHGDRAAYPRVAAFLDRATAPDAESRFASVGDALEVLGAAVQVEVVAPVEPRRSAELHGHLKRDKQKITIPVPMEHRPTLNRSRRRELGEAVAFWSNEIPERKPAHLVQSFHDFLVAKRPADPRSGWLMLDGAGWLDRVRRIKLWAGAVQSYSDWDLDTHFHEWVLRLYLDRTSALDDLDTPTEDPTVSP